MKNKVARHKFIVKYRARSLTWIAITLIIVGVVFIIVPLVYINFVLPLKEDQLLGEASINIQNITEASNTDTNITGVNTDVITSDLINKDLTSNKVEDQNTKTSPSTDGVIEVKLSAEDYFPAKIIIPLIDLNKTVYEGTDRDTLKLGPGHIKGTAFPGQEGRSAISGHRTTYGAPFSRLDELNPGDIIYLDAINGERFTYEVTQTVIVSPKDLYILIGSAKKELLLTTCTPKFTATKRLIIIAELKDV